MTGYLSDTFSAHFGVGANALGYAISITVLFSLILGVMFWRTSNLLPFDILREGKSGASDAAEKDGEPAFGEASIG